MAEKLPTNPDTISLKSSSKATISNWKILFFSLIALFIVYTNIATLASRTPYKDMVNLPIFAPIADLFDLFSVFAYYENINRKFVIQGLPEEKNNIPENWVVLDVVEKYFPYCEGARQMRMYLSRHYALGRPAHIEGLSKIAIKIRERYNRENPEKKVQKVSIGFAFWPRSFQGYMAELKPEITQYTNLYTEI
ncbi:MAG: hypothetical protein ACK481_07410 [Candidatus Melainabacteria bacterium]|jgi:hypothetical protein